MHSTLYISPNFSFHFIWVNRKIEAEIFPENLFYKQRREEIPWRYRTSVNNEMTNAADAAVRMKAKISNVIRTYGLRNGREERNRLTNLMRAHEPNTKLFQSRLIRTHVLCSLAGHMFAGAHSTLLSQCSHHNRTRNIHKFTLNRILHEHIEWEVSVWTDNWTVDVWGKYGLSQCIKLVGFGQSSLCWKCILFAERISREYGVFVPCVSVSVYGWEMQCAPIAFCISIAFRYKQNGKETVIWAHYLHLSDNQRHLWTLHRRAVEVRDAANSKLCCFKASWLYRPLKVKPDRPEWHLRTDFWYWRLLLMILIVIRLCLRCGEFNNQTQLFPLLSLKPSPPCCASIREQTNTHD